jgi:beta-phosphoglucomutase-like phosphatase (HAD superfamily)
MLYRNVLQYLQIEPQQCVAIEDSVAGVKAAAAAGIRTLGFAMLADSDQLLDAGACYAFSEMAVLPELLRSLEGVAL